MRPPDDFDLQARPTILIVDDTPANLQVLAQALLAHYAIRVAKSGPAALEIVQRPAKPDLILLDVMMPGMDGFEVCRHLKRDPATANIPVIFVTAMGDVPDQQRGFDLGAVDYITKPVEIPLVLARVRVHIQLKRKSEHLEQLALIDSLTDIPNRRALEDTLSRECGRSTRDGVPLSVLMIDIDHFKPYNDHYGHGQGDECLRRVTRALRESLQRPGDFVGRYGGEEFVVLLPDCDRDGALAVAEKLREAVAGTHIPHAWSSAADHVTVSIGLTTRIMAGGEPWTTLVDAADDALYRAKDVGRDRVVATP